MKRGFIGFGLGKRISSRKGQLAAFIIIGILIIAIAGAYLYIAKTAKKSEAEKIVEKGLEVSLDETKIKSYIDACIKKEGKELVTKIENQGGTLNLGLFRYYANIKYNYFCVEDENTGCANRLFTRLSMAKELDGALKAKLKECINLENFRKQGYDIKEGEIDAKTTIGVDDINFKISYPLTISKEGQSVSVSEFSADIASNLGMLYDLAAAIVYEESTNRYYGFDEGIWMNEHASQIQIEKHKPYPDIVYSLGIKDASGETESFNFGIRGTYTIYDIGKPAKQKTSMGYCKTKDNNCYADVDEQGCAKAGGEWSSEKIKKDECSGLSVYSGPECSDGECKNCGKRKNGESWCEYEGLTSPGFALVGSRHYKGVCIDGKIYYTECRDYREEICVENENLNVPKAVCRINRWQDCAEQKSKDSCMDNAARDCWWSDWLVLNRQQKCVSYVPPGFAHWQLNGQEACSMANEQFDCPYYTCGKSWVDSAALYCSFMGDCGNYRNTEGELTTAGFFSFDSTPSNYVYLADEQLGLKTKPMLKMDIESAPVLEGNEFENPHGDLNLMINKEIKYMDEVSGWSYEDFRNNYIFEGHVHMHTLQTTFCMPWNAPYKGKSCNECGSSARPCSEYKCKSLGQTCTYEEVNGIGFCYDYSDKDKIPPKLFFDGSTSLGFEVKEDIFEGMKGYRITPALQPYSPLVFVLNATEPVRCKTTALPQVTYNQISLPSSPVFSSIYVFTDIAPKPADFKIGLMKSLGINSFLELGTFETYDQKFNRLIMDAKKAVNNFNGIDKNTAMQNIGKIETMWKTIYAPTIRQLFDRIGDTLRDLAIQTEQGNKIIFFKCIDKAGNENKENIFLKYKIAKDIDPPAVVWAVPSNETGLAEKFDLVLYTTEPATCRYSLEDKDYDMMNSINEIECIEPTLFGISKAYICLPKTIEFGNRTKIDLFVRCKDKPTKIDRYAFNLSLGDEMSQDASTELAIGLDKGNDRINLTPHWAQYFNFPETVNINVANSEIEIVINVDEKLACRYANGTDMNFEEMLPMECKEGPSGIFPCRADVNVLGNTAVGVACMKEFTEEERNKNRESFILTYRK